MKKSAILLSAFLFFTVFIGYTQSLSPTVIASSGGFYETEAILFPFTVAEMTMVETFSAGGNILTQGFQQPEDGSVSIDEQNTTNSLISVYPNPTSGKFSLTYNSISNKSIQFRLLNLLGQVVLTQEMSVVQGVNTLHFDISNHPVGVYVLSYDYMDSDGSVKSDFQKINLEY